MSVKPSSRKTPKRVGCKRAFALACHYSGGHNLVEEIIASGRWPLDRDGKSFVLETVDVLIFRVAKGIPFPRFGLTLEEG